jgi:hypothetical protein
MSRIEGVLLRKSVLMKQLSNKAGEQKTLSSPLLMTARR